MCIAVPLPVMLFLALLALPTIARLAGRVTGTQGFISALRDRLADGRLAEREADLESAHIFETPTATAPSI